VREVVVVEYRQLGRAGLRVSVIALGGNTFGKWADAESTAEIVSRAIAAGINLVDTADLYNGGHSEALIGRALRGRRDQMLIATKVGMPFGAGPNDWGAARKRVVEGCEASLRRLQTTFLDLYLIHKWDPMTPLDETLGALDDLVRAGKVRYVGCSNYAAWQVVRALWVSDRQRFQSYVAVQPQYNLLDRAVERELLPCCLQLGLGVMAYYPLAAGILTGKYRPGEPWPEGTRAHNNPRFAPWLAAEKLRLVQRLDTWARGRDHTVTELALAWLASQPGISTVVVGVSTAAQLDTNARAADWRLTPGELAEVDAILTDRAPTDRDPTDHEPTNCEPMHCEPSMTVQKES
jgi:aryl-alcohol dehydrogenase-like predicted oxidoreductase